MIMEKINKMITVMRIVRDESDSLYEKVLFFVAFLVIGGAAILISTMLIVFIFFAPKFFIPIYLAVFLLWQGYKRL